MTLSMRLRITLIALLFAVMVKAQDNEYII